MARVDPTFIDRFGSHVDTLFHDIAHTSNGDSRAVSKGQIFFPLSRHKSWFDGHSFATGMFAFGNGKSQESSSEAVNAYYGAYLWSLQRHGADESDVTDFARLLLSTEIRGAKTYWHMVPPDSHTGKTTSSTFYNTSSTSTPYERLHVYPADFETHYMVGNVGMLDVAVNTWFGNDPLYVHMIQAIPITSVTRLLFDKSYVEQEYPYLMKSRSSVEMAWRGYTTCIHAIIDPNQAWEDAQGLVSYELDSALSKSQVLYFISQLPGFTAPPTPTMMTDHTTTTTTATTKTTTSQSSPKKSSSTTTDGSCQSNPVCDSQGLTGECCPTNQNVFLECCS
jgi:endo-1,3(4)-beta-glucanase